MLNQQRILHWRQRWSGVGAEPGINPDTSSISEHFHQNCSINVIEYSANSIEEKELDNKGLIDLLAEAGKGRVDSDTPPTDHKAGTNGCVCKVRWINVGGIDWAVMSALALRYKDVLHEQGHSHSKADYYLSHLFIRILCFSLVSPEDQVIEKPARQCSPNLEVILRRTSHDAESGELNPFENVESMPFPGKLNNIAGGYHDDVPSAEDCSRKYNGVKRVGGLSGNRGSEQEQQIMRIQALKGDRVGVKYDPMCIFLLRDGITVISIHSQPNRDFTLPIYRHLFQSDSLLRRTEDASLLVESLLDLIVDRVLEVLDVYQEKIGQLEQDVLINSNMETVRRLHILSGDLIMHKRGLEPIKAMIFGLRRYDHERCFALLKNEENSAGVEDHHMNVFHPRDSTHESGVIYHASGGSSQKVNGTPVKGYLSRTTKLYLADVNDHMDFVLSSTDMFSDIIENLINYAFNMASYETNAAMRRLTLVTIIFLPLTLLTGYFGMNFTIFPSIETHSDRFFWILAIPGVAVVIPIFAYPELKLCFRHFERKHAIRRAKKGYRPSM